MVLGCLMLPARVMCVQLKEPLRLLDFPLLQASGQLYSLEYVLLPVQPLPEQLEVYLNIVGLLKMGSLSKTHLKMAFHFASFIFSFMLAILLSISLIFLVYFSISAVSLSVSSSLLIHTPLSSCA